MARIVLQVKDHTECCKCHARLKLEDVFTILNMCGRYFMMPFCETCCDEVIAAPISEVTIEDVS